MPSRRIGRVEREVVAQMVLVRHASWRRQDPAGGKEGIVRGGRRLGTGTASHKGIAAVPGRRPWAGPDVVATATL